MEGYGRICDSVKLLKLILCIPSYATVCYGTRPLDRSANLYPSVRFRSPPPVKSKVYGQRELPVLVCAMLYHCLLGLAVAQPFEPFRRFLSLSILCRRAAILGSEALSIINGPGIQNHPPSSSCYRGILPL